MGSNQNKKKLKGDSAKMAQKKLDVWSVDHMLGLPETDEPPKKKRHCTRRCFSCPNTSSSNPEMSFFQFPKDETLLKLWEASTKSHKDKCLKKRYLCEKHFKNFQIRKHRIKNVLGPLTVPNEEISEEEYRCKVET